MNKEALLLKARAIQRMADELMGMVQALDDEPPQKPLPKMPKAEMAEPYMTARQVQKYLNISQTTFYDSIRDGRLPDGDAFGTRIKRWRLSEIEAWRKSRQKQK